MIWKNETEKRVSLLGTCPDGIILCAIEVCDKRKLVMMEPLSEEQENQMEDYKEKHGELLFRKGDGETYAEKDIFMYGKVDLDDPGDVESIRSRNLVNEGGSHMYSDFDYDAGDILVKGNVARCYDTFDPLLRFKLCHAMIGKPERVIVYMKKRKPRQNSHAN